MKKIYPIFIFTALILTINVAYSQNVANSVVDSSFETGPTGTAWAGTTTYLGSPLCDTLVGSAHYCGPNNGIQCPHSGAWYVWFGASVNSWSGKLSDGNLTQSVFIRNSKPAFLSFWYKMPTASKLDVDSMTIFIDNNAVWFSTNAGPDSTTYKSYTKISIPIDTYADDATHVLHFKSRTHGWDITNFLFDDVSLLTHSGVGIDVNHILEGISIYPNPTTEQIFIDINAPVATDYNVIMYNMQGQKVFEQNYTNFNNNKIKINTSGFAKGTYSIVMDSKLDRVVDKVIVQ